MLEIHPNAKFVEFEDSVQIVTALESITFDGGRELIGAIRKRLSPNTDSMSGLLESISRFFDNTEQCIRFVDFLRDRYILVEAGLVGGTSYESLLDILARNSEKYIKLEGVEKSALDQSRLLSPLKSVVVKSSGKFGDQLSKLLKPYGISVGQELGEHSSLQIYIGIEASAFEIANENDKLFAEGTPFLLANIDGSRLQIGPLVVPGFSACYRCSLRRAHANAIHKEEFIATRSSSNALSNDGAIKLDPILEGLLVNMLGNELLKNKVNSSKYSLVDRYLSFDAVTNDFEYVPILKVARCQTCSRLGERPRNAQRDLM